MTEPSPVLQVENLSIHYRGAPAPAVRKRHGPHAPCRNVSIW